MDDKETLLSELLYPALRDDIDETDYSYITRELDAIYRNGVCADCINYPKCDLSIYLKYTNKEQFNPGRSYCSEFEPKEPK